MRRAATPYLALLLIALVVTPSSAYGSLKQPSAVGVLRAQNNKLAQQNMIFRCGNEAAKQSMTQLFDEFDVEVFDASMPKEQQVKLQSAQGETENVGILPLLGLIGMVNNAVSAASTILSFFGRHYSERLVGHFDNNGYNKFKASAKILHGRGLAYDRVPKFMQLLARSKNIPSKYWAEMENAGKWAAYTTSSTVTKQTLLFSAGKGGDASVLQFYIENNREQKKLDVFTMTVDQKFELAPDVFVILEETSQFWGLSKSSKIRFKKMPANIKQDQIQFISDYFSLVALQELAEFLKVEKGVPNMKPKKASMDVAESDLADTWSSPKSQNLRATRTRWVNNLRQPSEKAVLKNGVDEDVGGYARNDVPFNTYGDEDIGGYARNNAPFNTYGDENFEGVGGFYRTANGERVVIHRNGNNHVVFRENGVREHHHKHGNAHNTVVFQKNGDRVHTHRLGGKVIKRVVFKRKL